MLPYALRSYGSGIDGYLLCIRASVNKVVDRKSSGEMQLWAVMGPLSEEERA